MKNEKLKLSSVLFEQTSPEQIQTIPTDVSQGETLQPQNYSLDQRVDKFIIQYERESNPQAAQFTNAGMDKALVSKGGAQGAGAGFAGGQSAVATPISMPKPVPVQENKKKNSNRKKSLNSLLFEQEDPLAAGGDDAGGLDDLGGGDTGGDALGGGDDSAAPPPATTNVPKPQINLSIFANKVARLVSNFETLIDPKVVVVNRVYSYIRQNYDENTAKELLIILENNYSITNKSTEQTEKDRVGDVPAAVGAGPDVSGGGS